MPLTVRLFFWLTVALAAYWIAWCGWDIYGATTGRISAFAIVPSQFQDAARRDFIQQSITSTLSWAAPVLLLAWLAAYKRANWARWGCLIFFIAVFANDILLAGLFLKQALGTLLIHDPELMDIYFRSLPLQDWTSPRLYLNSALALSAAIFAFLPPSRPWFAKPG